MKRPLTKRQRRTLDSAFGIGLVMIFASPIFLFIGIGRGVEEFGIPGLFVGAIPGLFLFAVGLTSLVWWRNQKRNWFPAILI